MDEREYYAEVNALLGAVGKALDLTSDETVKALEAGDIAMEMQVDDLGQHFVAVTFQGRSAQIYQGAIRHAPEPTAEEDFDDGAGCGHGGCGCGRGR